VRGGSLRGSDRERHPFQLVSAKGCQEGAPTDSPFPFIVFARLTDGQGEIQAEVVIERQEDAEVIYPRTVAFSLAHPLHEARVRLRVVDYIFPAQREYRIDLMVQGESVAHTCLTILLEGQP
jgi:hypothetical protein